MNEDPTVAALRRAQAATLEALKASTAENAALKATRIEDAVKALWAVVSAEKTDWDYRLGIVVKNGVLCEVLQPAAEMHHPAGTPYTKPITPELLAQAEARLADA